MTPAAILSILVKTEGVGAAQAQLSKLDRTSRKAGDGLGHVSDKATKSRRSFASISTAAYGAAAGIGGLVVVGGSLIKAYEESAKVSKLTNSVIKSTGGVAKVSAKQVADLSGAISQKTGIDDEAIQSGANLLLTFKNIRNETGKGKDIFNQATQAAVDLSAAGFGSLSSTSKQLGKALNDPVKGMTALGRAGVTFSEDQKKAIAALVETGKSSDRVKAQQKILKEVMSQVGGAAAAQGTPFEKLGVTLENLQETLGGLLAPAAEDAATKLNKFIGEVQDGTGAGGEFADSVKDVVKPVVGIAKGIGSFAKANPELAKAAASMAIIGGGAVKFGKLTGANSVLKFAFQKGNTPANPLWVQSAGGPGRVPGGVAPVPLRTRVARRIGGAVLPAAATAVAVNAGSSLPARAGQAATGAWLGAKVGGPVGAGVGAVLAPAVAKELEQSRLKGQDVKTLKGVYDALKVNTAEAGRFKAAMSQAGGSIAGIKTGKLQELKVALGLVSFGSEDARNKASKLAGIVDRELAGRMVSKVRGAWAAAKSSTDTNLSDINRIVQRNMGRVRSAMSLDSDKGAQAIRANFGGAVSAIETAMGRGRVSVQTGMDRINSLLSTELKTLGVNFTWGASANTPGLANSPVLPKPKVYQFGAENARGGLIHAANGMFQIGRAGDRGQDTIPMTFGGQKIMVGSGEVGAVLNRHQQAELNARTADVGGLSGFFQRFKKPHYMASGGISGGRVSGPSATAAIATGVLAKAAAKANQTLTKVKDAKPAETVGPAGGPEGTSTYDGKPVAKWIIPALTYARRNGWAGRLTSGYRSHAHNVAQGRNYFSNHEGVQYPSGAVDVGGYEARAEGASLNAALSGYTGSRKLVWGGPVINDWGHFSATGHAAGGLVKRLASGGFVSGRGSWFGGPHDSMDSGKTASGGTTATPGIAVRPGDTWQTGKKTLGHYWKVTAPNGRSAILKQTDLGPNQSTGRRIDITYSALDKFGYTEGNFPTDAIWKATDLGTKASGKAQKPGMSAFGNVGAKVTAGTPFRSQASVKAERKAFSIHAKRQGEIRAANTARGVAAATSVDNNYLLSTLTPDKLDDAATAKTAFDFYDTRVQQYAYGLKHGDSRVTGDMLREAVSSRDTYAEILKPQVPEATNDIGELLKGIKDLLAAQDTRAKAVTGTVDGELTRWVTEMISGRMATTASLGGQVPSSPGLTARL